MCIRDRCKEFYKKYGYLSFFGNEIYGIDPEDDSGILEGNSVAYALNDLSLIHIFCAYGGLIEPISSGQEEE